MRLETPAERPESLDFPIQRNAYRAGTVSNRYNPISMRVPSCESVTIGLHDEKF